MHAHKLKIVVPEDHQLSDEERDARLRQIRGIGRGLLSSSEEFSRQKQEEIDLEERRFGRR
jgi:hypothetical protein